MKWNILYNTYMSIYINGRIFYIVKMPKMLFLKSTCKNNRIWIQVCNAKTVRWWQEMEALSWSLTIIHDMSGIQRDHQKMTKMTFPSPSRSRMSWKFFFIFYHDECATWSDTGMYIWEAQFRWVYYSSVRKTLEHNFYFN